MADVVEIADEKVGKKPVKSYQLGMSIELGKDKVIKRGNHDR